MLRLCLCHRTATRKRCLGRIPPSRSLSDASGPLAENPQETSRSDGQKSTRLRLLEESLKQVQEHGWSSDAILAAVRREFPKASPSLAGTIVPQDVVTYAMNHWNDRLRQELMEQTAELQQKPFEDRIVFALKLRLEYQTELIQHRQWHHGMALGVSSPTQALQTTQQLQELIQIVVAQCTKDNGDDKPPVVVSELAQLGLGGVYVATELHMLADSSTSYCDTWDFLQRRVQQWQQNRHTLEGVLPTESQASLVSTVSTAFASGILSVLQLDPQKSAAAVAQVSKTATDAVDAAMSRLEPPQFRPPSTSLRSPGTRPEDYAAPPPPASKAP